MVDKGDDKRPLSLGARPGGKIEIRKPIETGSVRQSFPHGRSKTVQVEVRKKRAGPGAGPSLVEKPETPAPAKAAQPAAAPAPAAAPRRGVVLPHGLTPEEAARRARALKGAIKADEEEQRRQAALEADRQRQQAADQAALRKPPAEAPAEGGDAESRKRAAEAAQRAAEKAAEDSRREVAERAGKAAAAKVAALTAAGKVKPEEEEEEGPRRGPGAPKRPVLAPRRDEPRQRRAKLTVTRALNEENEERIRSEARVKRQREKLRQQIAQEPQPQLKQVREVVVPEAITVQELANRMAERSADVIKALMKMGVVATINQTIDTDTAELLVTEFGHKIKRVAEADVEVGLKGESDSPESLKPRPPVVTVMGHVDHGKTSLLDALRSTDVAAGEAGGITQHIGAYKVKFAKEGSPASGREIVFLDTPGHEAFTRMRARGAKVTDIVVIVVAADDGVMPQTIEAIAHAKAAEVPIIVAVNKIDKPDANPDRVKKQLADRGLVPEEWAAGGEGTVFVEVSAKKRIHLDLLLEMICLVSDLKAPKATPGRKAVGSVLEAKLDRGRGAVATVLVQDGTLHLNDSYIVGNTFGKVRAMFDDRGRPIEEAGPSTPVEVLGLESMPDSGDTFLVVADRDKAKGIAQYRKMKERDAQLAKSSRVSLEGLAEQIRTAGVKDLPLIIKGDVTGSVEVLADSLVLMSTEKVRVKVIHSGVGSITESDVLLATASNAIIIGFNVRPERKAAELAQQENVEIRLHSIIYELQDEMRLAMLGLLDPTFKENYLGRAEVINVFRIPKVGTIAGCRVQDGSIRRDAEVKVMRGEEQVFKGKVSSLKRFKDDAREVTNGMECGIGLGVFNDIKEGDLIEAFSTEKLAADLGALTSAKA